MSTQLGGTGRLADDLWLVAHHEITGKPHLQPRAAGVGLAGGLLAELMLAGGIRLWRGMIVPAGGPVSRDGLARAVLVQVTSEREYLPPRDWLLFLARTAAADVATRLEHAGYLTRAPARRRWCGASGGFPWTPTPRSRRWSGSKPPSAPPARSLRRTRPWAAWPSPAGWATSCRCTCLPAAAGASTSRSGGLSPAYGS